MKAPLSKESFFPLGWLMTNTYTRLKTSYIEKKLKKEEKISRLKTAMLSGSIRKIK